jgi:autoinducer-2 kinase
LNDRERSNLLMAIDAGTGSCRAIIFDRSGHQISSSQAEWSHIPESGVGGSQIFDTFGNWKLISQCIRNSLTKAGLDSHSICAVSTTSMREGIVLYDGSGQELWACPNVDSRAKVEAERLVRSGKARRIYSLSGDWISITSPPRFLWIKKHKPEIFRRISHVGMISDWISYRLSGKFVTDPSAGSSSGMFDLKNRTWSEEIIEICGLKEEVFPEITDPGSVAGGVSKSAYDETGLSEGTPVVVGGADTQLGLVGLGVAKPNSVTLLGGTFWQQTMLLDRAVIDPKMRLRTLCHAVEKRWMIEGIGFYCGLVMRWFRDAFCQEEKAEAEKKGVDPYVLLEEEARSAPVGSNGLVGIFSNVMNAKSWKHATPSFMQFDVMNPEKSGKKECIRAIEEAAAFVALGHLIILQSLSRRKIKEITFAGGGAKGTLWPQIVSDCLGVTVSIPVVKESTALGAAICAGVGAGFYRNLEEGGAKLSKKERTIEPNSKNHDEYLSLYYQWLKIYDGVQLISDGKLLAPMWSAAGAMS